MADYTAQLQRLIEKLNGPFPSLNSVCHNEHLLELAREMSSWKTIAPWLGFSPQAVEDIDEQRNDSEGKCQLMLMRWKQNKGSDATYRELATGMIKGGRMNLAEFVLRASNRIPSQCQVSPVLPSSTVGETTNYRSSPNPAPAPVIPPKRELSLRASTPPPPPPTPPAPPPTPPTTSLHPDRVAQVVAEIDKLRDSYSDLTSETRDELCVRENADPSFLKKFRDRLFDLPIAKKVPHDRFFHKNEDELLRAKDVEKIFAILRRYCSYSNYEILREVVTKFCKALLQQRMGEYIISLEIFEKATTIDVYLVAENVGPVLTEKFKKMAITINKPLNECTLHEVRKLKEKIAEEASVYSHCAYVVDHSVGSVKVELAIHVRCVGKILAVLTPPFLSTHLLSNVMLDGESLVTMDNVPQKELNEELISASERGDIMRVTSVLNSGADIQTVDDYGYSSTALDWACEKGHLQIVHLLIVRGSVVDSRDKFGSTPLITAAAYGHYQIVILLLSLEADVNVQTNDGSSALVYAAWGGHSDIVMELVKAGAILDLQDSDGDSALIRAAFRGHSEVVMELVKAGANLNLQNNDGNSALIEATSEGHSEVLKVLVKAGANLNLQNKDGDSAVIRATAHYRPAVLKELVKAKSNLNLQNQEGLSALIIASRSKRSDLVKILLDGEDIDLSIQQNETGWSALFFSMESGDRDTTLAIIKAGANTNLRDRNGLTAVEVSLASGNNTDDVCQLLAQVSTTPDSPPTPDQDTTLSLSQQDSPPTLDQDTTHQQESSTIRRDEVVTHQDLLHTEEMPSGQNRRRNISETMRNLVNRSRKLAVEIFNNLDRRLKSADKKDTTGRETDKMKQSKTQPIIPTTTNPMSTPQETE